MSQAQQSNGITDLITATFNLISNLTKPSEAGQLRKNVRMISKNKKKMYRQFKKDGFTDEEKKILENIDKAWEKALLKLSE